MSQHPLAGRAAPPEMLIDVDQLHRLYYDGRPDPANPAQRVSFGTSGHRGTPLDGSFTEAHILVITQAIVEDRASRGIGGPLILGKDTHAVSTPAERTALEVLAASGVDVVVQAGDGYTPTPAVSRAILAHNEGRSTGLADGIVVTPSHNPPADGGFKYNPPDGGPADTDVTGWIQERANELLAAGPATVRRTTLERARAAATTHERDLVEPYVRELASALDLEPLRAAGLRLGVDPLGGASLAY
jgi:phosphoglucomutase